MTTRRSIPAASVGRLLLRSTLAALALAAVAACGGGASADRDPVATSTVDLPASYRFAPTAISVPAGTTVTWTNNDNFTHNVRFDGEEPLTMAPGQSATKAFPTPGTYAYVCSLHPRDMQGSVLVTGS